MPRTAREPFPSLWPVPIAAALALLLAPALGMASGSPSGSFVNFETGQVRPLALSPDGSRLFAINTPDNRLEILSVTAGGVTRTGAVPVGLEPIAVAVRNAGEVWVVNHLSDSVSIVDVSATPPRVKRTLLTCDEPRDIVFAGPGNDRAFITTARRGQNCPVDDALTTPGLGRAVVQVYDAAALELDGTLAGTPIANVVLFGDTPRALARSADGNTVYAAVFHSGNQTTALSEGAVCDGGAGAPPCGGSLQFAGGLPAPNENIEGLPQPEVGLIVRFNAVTGKWEDELARDWSGAVRFSLPDLDVFAIDAAAVTPVEAASFAHVGTVLFNMAANPVNGKVYVSNTEARNEVRFEGPGTAFGSTTVQGHLHEARITVLDGASVLPRHLNKHIDYAERPAPAGVKERSLATPVGMAVTADGATLYVAAFSSSKLGVFSTAELENDTFVPSASAHIPLSGGGPSGVVLDEAHDRAYVLTRFDDAVSVVQLSTRTEVAHVRLHTPEPPAVIAGRPVLYDAVLTSSNGEASCASCHVFGDFDSLAWDLGNPDEVVLNNPLPFRIPFSPFDDFHPLKGPMTTQSLRGMANHGSMHWRGDRTMGNDPPLFDSFDEDGAFKKFNPAFVGLIGRESELSDEDMQAFTDFALTITYPPNPIRRLNGNLTAQQTEGRDLYFGRITDVLFNCNGCHTLDQSAGFFGTDGFATFEGETQAFKVTHLRNVYQKIGMFGSGSVPPAPQIRGFGFLHDGSVDTVFSFLSAVVFDLIPMEQRRLEQFMLAYDSNLAPIVGQQVTLTSTNALAVDQRINLMIARDTTAEECEVIMQGTIAGEARGAYLAPDGLFHLDRAADAPLSGAALQLLAATPGQEQTYTCAPFGSGLRMGVDRDEDGYFDRDEIDGGSDPANALSIPIPPTPIRSSSFSLRDDDSPPINLDRRKLSFKSSQHQGTASGVTVPPFDGSGDPTIGGAMLQVFGPSSTVTVLLPASHWERVGSATKPGYKYADKRREIGPITGVAVKDGSLRVKGKGGTLYSLAAAPQGTMNLRLQLGSGVLFCTATEPKEPATSNDTTSRYNGAKHTPPPASCPAPVF